MRCSAIRAVTLLLTAGAVVACSAPPPGPADGPSPSAATAATATASATTAASATVPGSGSGSGSDPAGGSAAASPSVDPLDPPGSSPVPEGATGSAERPFNADSPFNVPVAAGAALDPDTAAMVARISRAGLGHANLVEFGIPIYAATADTPRRMVRCTITEWGV